MFIAAILLSNDGIRSLGKFDACQRTPGRKSRSIKRKITFLQCYGDVSAPGRGY